MSTYPKLVVCPIVGVSCIVRSAEEEREFFRAPLPVLAAGMIALLAIGACMLYALVTL